MNKKKLQKKLLQCEIDDLKNFCQDWQISVDNLSKLQIVKEVIQFSNFINHLDNRKSSINCWPY
jgi:hypothetical protein